MDHASYHSIVSYSKMPYGIGQRHLAHELQLVPMDAPRFIFLVFLACLALSSRVSCSLFTFYHLVFLRLAFQPYICANHKILV
jgi:hypothetical protein